MPTNSPIAFDDDLRGRIADRLAVHDRLELPLEGRRHAAVAIMVVDSTTGADVEFEPTPDEVLATYRIGLHELARPASPQFVDIPESDRPVVQVPLGGDLIHAPTGAVIVNFRWLCVDGRTSSDSRVVDFEQPVFAWG